MSKITYSNQPEFDSETLTTPVSLSLSVESKQFDPELLSAAMQAVIESGAISSKETPKEIYEHILDQLSLAKSVINSPE